MAEGGGLLNRYTGITRIVGSNPIPSAIIARKSLILGRIVWNLDLGANPAPRNAAGAKAALAHFVGV